MTHAIVFVLQKADAKENAWENGRKLKEAGRAIKANLTLSEGKRKESLPGSTLDHEQSKGSSKEHLARLWGSP